MKHKLMILGVLVTAGATFTGGCVIQGSGSGLALAGNGALAASGAIMIADASATNCESAERTGLPFIDFIASLGTASCEGGKKVESGIGTIALVAGAVGLLATYLANKKPRNGAEGRGVGTARSGADFGAQLNGPAPTRASQPDVCAEELATFRRETDDADKLQLLDKMRPECRAQLTRIDWR